MFPYLASFNLTSVSSHMKVVSESDSKFIEDSFCCFSVMFSLWGSEEQANLKTELNKGLDSDLRWSCINANRRICGMMIHFPENWLVGRWGFSTCSCSPVYVTMVMYLSETERYTGTSNDSGRNNWWWGEVSRTAITFRWVTEETSESVSVPMSASNQQLQSYVWRVNLLPLYTRL